MTPAHDVFAELNPAYCGTALAAFVGAYKSLNDAGPELAICYIALPVGLSGDLAETFAGTNRNTGLLEWLTRSPQVHIGLGSRVNSTMDVVTSSLRFGCFANLLILGRDGRLQVGNRQVPKSSLDKLGAESVKAIKRVERLGYWFAMAGTTRNVFGVMGLTV
ncbi:three component ABC system middle component [Lysobacter sp. Root690]|uniref:three component ABC system middle component n=1 Tax=Lysobacter sp. Root690 TaxID=1736588 RepID=UPI0009EB6B65|nr:three component ABC system middle component [Lysobacter sp. Root690]